MNRAEKRRRQRRAVLGRLRLSLCAFTALVVLAVLGVLLIRSTLIRNAHDTGTALSRSFAAEESNTLAMYETLLSFGTASLDSRVEAGEGRDAIIPFLKLYFQRLDSVLGDGVVDPYVVFNGEILGASPWEGDASYDYTAASWYQMAMEAQGQVIFTNLYTDVTSGYPVITAAQKCAHSDAVMAFDILPERFQFTSVELAQGGSFFLCDSAGAVLYQQTDLELPDAQIQQYLNSLITKIEAGELDSASDAIHDLEGEQRAVCYTRMDNGWYSIVTLPYTNILGNLHWFALTLAVVVLALLLILAVMTHRELRMGRRIERTNETVRVLGNSYYALYRVDYERETYEMIKGSDYVRSRIPAAGPYADLLRTAGEVIEADAYRDFTKSFSCENIRELVRQRVRDFGGEFLRRFGDGYRWVSVRVLFDESLAPEEVVLSFREVEEAKQRQLRERRLLEESLQLAQRNEESKHAFFRNMSHDMRTPLNGILGLTQLAEQHLEEPQRAEGYLKQITSSTRYLLELINDILDMSRMEQGKIVLDNCSFDLQSCVEECLAPFQAQAEQEGKTLRCTLSLTSRQLMGDPFRIRQILNNLLSNAFKFTPAGGSISVSVTQMDQDEFSKFKFVVADTGIGMSPEFIKRLYEPYAREMRFSAKQASGTGLGMSITKNLVSQMDGEIQVESAPGQGTTFTVILPFAAAQEAEPAGQGDGREDYSLEGLHILLAEDNEINMEITTELLSAQGVHVTQAWNGQEAVQLFRQSAPGFFDAILMDMQMPKLDGCGAARAIRALDRADARQVPILAVTANAFSEDIAATAAAGMNAHVSKPIDFQILCRTLGRLARSDEQAH